MTIESITEKLRYSMSIIASEMATVEKCMGELGRQKTLILEAEAYAADALRDAVNRLAQARNGNGKGAVS